MTGRVLGRVLQAILVMWGTVTLAFFALHFLPGDPVDILLGNDPYASEQLRAQVVAFYGLDRPVFEQYLLVLGRLVQGDLGQSFQLHQPVWTALSAEILSTVQLALAAMAVAVVVSPLLALITSGRSRWVRSVTNAVELVAISIPPFWLGILLLTLFSFTLGWVPINSADGPESLILPTLTLALPVVGTLTQLIRGAMDEVLEQPFTTTARARGLTSLAVRTRHGLRHSALPALTLAGQFLGTLLGGAIIVESVFGRPGVGRLTLAAINGKDIPVITAVVLLSALAYVVTSLVVDILYPILDPRLRARAEQVAL